MKSVSKKIQAEIDLAMTLYNKAKEDLETSVADTNEKISKLMEDVNDHVETMNSAIARLNELRVSVEEDITQYIDDKSDNWRDGERGSAYQEWQSSWENELDDIEKIEVPEVEMPDDMADEPLNDGDYPREPNL
jgi:uncharacterized protein YukE